MAALVVQKSPSRGAMISIGLSAKDITSYLAPSRPTPDGFELTVSCFNSENNITVSGPEQQIDELKAQLDEDKIFARKLRVPLAYHSNQMELVAEQYTALMGDITLDTPTKSIPMVSSVTKAKIDPVELCQPDYWVKNLTSPVHFCAALHRLCLQNRRSLTVKIDRSHHSALFVDHLIEIGPHAALQAPIRDCLKQVQREEKPSYSSALHRNRSSFDSVLELAGLLHGLGVPVDLRQINDPFEPPNALRIALADLPGYPFDHNKSYWHESRISSDYRLRHFGHVALLGSPSPDWNPLDAQWRNVFSPDDIPWIDDHKINGIRLVPGAGMIVMAIQAITQLAKTEREIIGYRFRNIVFGVALEFPQPPEDMETRFALRSLQNPHGQDNPWHSFSVYSLKAGKWTEHCKGTVQLQLEDNQYLALSESINLVQQYRELLQLRRTDCDIAVNSDRMYEFLRQRGIEYGPAFRRMEMLNFGDKREIVTEVSLSREPGSHPAGAEVIHPATLDAVMHSVFAAQSRGATEEIDTQVPTAIRQMWISRKGLDGHRGDSIVVTAKINTSTPLKTKSSLFALGKAEKDVLILIEGLEMSTVAQSAPIKNLVVGGSQTWSRMECTIDIDLLNNDRMLDWLNRSSLMPKPEPVAFYRDIRFYLRNVLSVIKENMERSGYVPSQSHLRRYMAWIDWQLEKTCESGESSNWTPDGLDHRIREEGSVGLLFSKTAQLLDDIVRERSDVLRLLFEDSMVEDFYEASSQSSTCYAKLQTFLAAAARKRPKMRVLEVGAGTGVFTRMILDALSVRHEGRLQARLFDQYHFTDKSPSFFTNAQRKFADYGHKINFQVFDIEADIANQGQQEATYDIIIAANVIHIVQDLGTCLQSLRKLLKTGGKLVLHETTTPDDITTGFVFGLLQDWWPVDDPARTMSPLITEDSWHILLKKNGYSGIDIVLRDFESDCCHQSSIMISTALASSDAACSLPSATIVIDPSSGAQRMLAEKLQERLLKNYQCLATLSTVQAESCQQPLGALRIFLLEFERPILPVIDSSMFAHLKACLENAEQVLWATGGGGPNPPDPGFGMIDGLARSLRLERNDMKFVTLALDTSTVNHDSTADHIVQVMCQAFSSLADNEYEREYVEISGALHLRRLTPAMNLKTDMLERLEGKRVRSQSLESSKPFRLRIPNPGQINSVDFVADNGSGPSDLGQDEIEIEVKAVGLNTRDTMQALGLVEGDNLGIEAAGVVRRLATGATSSIQIGDRVCMLGTNLCQSYARTMKGHMALIPEDVTFEQASVLPFRSWLAYYLVNEVARVEKGESVLLTDGASAQGQLVIPFAQEIQALIHATVESEEDSCMLRKNYGLTADRILLQDQVLGFSSLMRPRQRFDVVFDFTGETDRTEILESIRPFGRLVHLTGLDNTRGVGTTLSGLGPNITIHTVDATSLPPVYHSKKPRPLQSIINRLGRRTHDLQSIDCYPVSSTPEAFRALKERASDTRTVLMMDNKDTIPVRCSPCMIH